MRDEKVSLPRIMQLHPKIRFEVEAAINFVETKYFPSGRIAIRVVQGLRSIEYQDQLYAQGRTAPGHIVTNSRGGSSYHNYGLAIDFALLYDKDGNGTFEELSWNSDKDFDLDGVKDWKEVYDYFISLGYVWGGNFKSIKDKPHLEKSFGYSVKTLFGMYKSKLFIKGTQYLNI